MVKEVNVAPSSTEGHFVKEAKSVIELDLVNETFHVKGKSTLHSKNHTTLEMNEEECLITCQVVYNPFSALYNKAMD